MATVCLQERESNTDNGHTLATRNDQNFNATSKYF